MFMSAQEIRQDYQGLDADREDVMGAYSDRFETDTEMFSRKYDEAEYEGLVDDLSDEGVKNPVSLQADRQRTGYLDKPEILGGHHRVAVMERLRPNELMPVEHFDNYLQAQRSLGDRY